MMAPKHKDLLQAATALLKERHNPPVHSVAAALRTKDGKVVTSVNSDHFSGFVCAETAALSKAIDQGLYDFDCVVAVRKEDEAMAVANMCGKCRQIFHDYAPGIQAIVLQGNELEVKHIEDLLPYAFTRQQQKIQAAIAEEWSKGEANE